MRDEAPDLGASSPELAGGDAVGVIRDSFGNRRRVPMTAASEPRVPVAKPNEPRVPVPTIPPPSPRPKKHSLLWFLLTLGVVAVLALFGWNWTLRTPRTAAAVLEQPRRDLAWSSLEVRADGRGSVLEVSGPDSEMVLMGYCEPWPSRSVCEAIKVTNTDPPQAGVRLGLFKDPQRAELQAIRIERRQDGGRWVAGGGGEPLLPMDAPEIPEGTPAVPVSRWD